MTYASMIIFKSSTKTLEKHVKHWNTQAETGRDVSVDASAVLKPAVESVEKSFRQLRKVDGNGMTR